MSLHNMRPPKWSRLDNAAKIFPPISHGANTGVFRLSCELTEPADPALLQQALDETLLRYPYLKMVLRRGVFWHYLEQTNLRPLVEPEHEPPCAALYKGSRSLLLRVNYFGRMINLEMFHVLADGSGAMAFFQALVTEYLALRHPEAGEISLPQASVGQRASDSFQKYYQPRLRLRSAQAEARLPPARPAPPGRHAQRHRRRGGCALRAGRGASPQRHADDLLIRRAAPAPFTRRCICVTAAVPWY